jgi:RND superfamily putative drug exporter
MAVGGVLVALAAAGVSLVALPAALAALGPRVNAGAPRRWQRGAERGWWARLAHAVMRRPGAVAAGSAALLVALGLPFGSIEFTGVDARVLPPEASARQVADVLERGGETGRFAPLHVVLREPPNATLRTRLAALPGVAATTPPRQVGALWRLDVVPRERALAPSSQRLVGLVRAATPPDALVGGAPAAYRDQQASLAARLPYALVLLAATTLVLLFLFTGSVLLPVKALVMNVLTLAAAFGVLVAVFLWWNGEEGLESTQPVLLFALAFGLATDYGVFLLSRIKEAHDAGLGNRDAVATGLARTGRIVTAAALLFCVAIGSFATSEIVFVRELALGAAVAVALDATVVRALLVPSLMALVGDWNWWAPAPLRRLHERLGLAG